MVWIYARKDEIPMEGHDAILIGSVLNFYSGSSSRLTTCDAVNIINAYLRLLKAALFPNGYPEAIEGNSSLKNRIVRLRTMSKTLHVRDVNYIVTQVGLLSQVGASQSRTLSVVGLGIFRYHDQQHTVKCLFGYVDKIPLRMLMYEFVWSCSTVFEQRFVLEGFMAFFVRQKKRVSRSEVTPVVAKKPKGLEEHNYRQACTSLRILWQKLQQRLALLNEISEETLFEPTDLDERNELPWETTLSNSTQSYVDKLFLIVLQNYSLTIFTEDGTEECEEFINRLAASEGLLVEISKPTKKKITRKVTVSTESESSVGTEDTSKNGNQLPTTELCGPAVIENSRDGNGDEPTVQPTHLQISKNDPGKILPPSVPTNGTGNPATVPNESSNTIDERNERSTNQN